MRTWSERVSESLRRALVSSDGNRATLPRPGRRRILVDPFCALEVQLSLTRLEAELAELRRDDERFARGHHLIAARLAFDQLLEQACRLAGVQDLPEGRALRRVVAEAELRTRGWTW